MEQIVEIEGRLYRLVTDAAKRNECLHSYAQVYRIRKDGTQGRRITTLAIVFAVVDQARKLEG